MIELKDSLFKELVKNGYSQTKKGKVWDIANRSLLYMTPELAESFLKLRSHPRYRRTVVEIEEGLIREHAEKFVKEISNGNCNLIDMGCGDGTKAKTFVTAINGKCKIRFCPVNVNENLVNLAMKNVKEAKISNIVDYKPYIADLESLDDVVSVMRSNGFQRNIILLLGSILASFDIHEYLFNLSQAMFKDDVLIIGNGIRKGERFSGLDNYKHNLFSEWLAHSIKGLGFKEEEIEYDARFANGRVECYYSLNADKKITHDGKEVGFHKGDEIVTAVLYKYYEHELEEFCKMYFREVEILIDSGNEYALVICRK